MRRQEYVLRLALAWLNQGYRLSFSPAEQAPPVEGFWEVRDPSHGGVSFYVHDLFANDDAWQHRAQDLTERLDEARPGSYFLWVPPGGMLPGPEPEESDWVRRVVLAGSRLASGRSGEARFPVKLTLGKLRDEGGHASVSGGLGRHWTEISNHLDGSYFIESVNLKRLTQDDDERRTLYENIGLLSQGVATGEVTEFEHEDAWTLQRMPRGSEATGMSDGWAIGGCPPGFEPDNGAIVRRLLRTRLKEAQEVLAQRQRPWVLVLSGAYDYMANENAGPSLRGFDPALSAAFDGILLVADGAVKPLVLGPGLALGKPGVTGSV